MAPHPTPDGGFVITEEITALRRRAISGALSAMVTGGHEALSFWQGYHKALADLASGAGELAALKDAGSAYEPASVFKGAWASLAEHPEGLTTARLLQVFAAEGIELPAEHIAKLDIVGGEVAEHGAVTALGHVHHKLAATLVDGNDGSGVHVGSVGALQIMVAQGSAA